MTWREKSLLWTSILLVGGSGVVYAWMKYLVPNEDPYAVVNHPLQPLFLKLHVLGAPLLVFAVGLVFSRHVWGQFRAGFRRGRGSGLVMLGVLAPMIVSGYLIQVATAPGWLRGSAIVHLSTGLGFIGGFAGHQAVALSRAASAHRRRRRASGRGTVTEGKAAP